MNAPPTHIINVLVRVPPVSQPPTCFLLFQLCVYIYNNVEQSQSSGIENLTKLFICCKARKIQFPCESFSALNGFFARSETKI